MENSLVLSLSPRLRDNHRRLGRNKQTKQHRKDGVRWNELVISLLTSLCQDHLPKIVHQYLAGGGGKHSGEGVTA